MSTWYGKSTLNGVTAWFAHCTTCHRFSRPMDNGGNASRAAIAHRCDSACRHCQFSVSRLRGGSGGRGLCYACYRNPEIRAEYERLTRYHEDTMEDYDLLRRQGFTVRQAAARMGMTYFALDRALYRAKVAGDARAVRILPPPTSRKKAS